MDRNMKKERVVHMSTPEKTNPPYSQKDLELWARSQVKPWGELVEADYDFRSWVDPLSCKDNRNDHRTLWLGTIYEYARESRKLRGLLAIKNLPRVDSKSSKKNSNDHLPLWVKYARERGKVREESLICQSFEGLTEARAASGRGSFYVRYRELASELVANEPFAKVSEQRCNQALETPIGPKTTGQIYFERAGVNEGLALDLQTATTLETFVDESRKVDAESASDSQPFRERHFTKRGEETIAVRVNWKDYTDKELGQAFENFAKDYRPVKRFPAPTRKGRGKSTTLLAALDGLSAMRLISYFSVQEAIGLFNKIALIQSDGKEESNFRTKARMAVADFKKYFPWETGPENGGTWAKRRR